MRGEVALWCCGVVALWCCGVVVLWFYGCGRWVLYRRCEVEVGLWAAEARMRLSPMRCLLSPTVDGLLPGGEQCRWFSLGY
jgi:hypothetical protein